MEYRHLDHWTGGSRNDRGRERGFRGRGRVRDSHEQWRKSSTVMGKKNN